MSHYHDILKQYWGYDSFRGIQEEIIESIGAGRDTLGLMPTGGGKSITFQVPALSQDGLCLVITPLIALMKDQVANLRARGIKAAAVYAGLTHEEIIVALENCIYGDYKFLYISPERIASELFQAKLKHMKVSFVTVDESHCISQWGYDFRPAYLKIADLRKILPHAPILALTATATPEVVKDIQQRLAFKEENVFKMSFERKNLAYVVRHTECKEDEVIHILNKVGGTAIIYTRNREKTQYIAKLLREQGITAEFYHAGLDNKTKDIRQRKWQSNESRVMVATNAFGMGIDKPDVRVVIHVDLPDSPEAYFQEAGRAGRDGELAYAILLTGDTDKMILSRRVPNAFPDKEFIRTVYEQLSYFYQIAMGSGQGETHDFDINKFCQVFKHFPITVESALRLLTQAGYIEYIDEPDATSRLMFTIRRDELYNLRENETDDRIIRTLLRFYSGLFSDYAYIDEKLLAEETELSPREVYEALKSLSYRRVIHYIPHKNIPLIRYTRRREEAERIRITPEIYEQRKERYEQRIKAMIRYISEEQICRSRMLLQYFGEENKNNCRKCDVCLAKHPSGSKFGLYEDVAGEINQLLEEKGETTLPQLQERIYQICNYEQTLNIVKFMIENGEIIRQGEKIYRKKEKTEN